MVFSVWCIVCVGLQAVIVDGLRKGESERERDVQMESTHQECDRLSREGLGTARYCLWPEMAVCVAADEINGPGDGARF